ncbi:hypothetical protein ACWDTD_19365 [Gordonia sp. NPDC003425]
MDTVNTAVDGANDPDNPIEQLARIAATRNELVREEAIAVRRARNAGLSWAEIGTLLGVSKQAMHKKYRKIG